MTPPALVVDASVAVKWILPEDVHVLWKRVRRKQLTAAQARQCAAYLSLSCPVLIHSDDLAAAALELAMAHGRPLYDCLYLALALERQCDLVTADEKFFASARHAFTCVRLLADWR